MSGSRRWARRTGSSSGGVRQQIGQNNFRLPFARPHFAAPHECETQDDKTHHRRVGRGLGNGGPGDDGGRVSLILVVSAAGGERQEIEFDVGARAGNEPRTTIESRGATGEEAVGFATQQRGGAASQRGKPEEREWIARGEPAIGCARERKWIERRKRRAVSVAEDRGEIEDLVIAVDGSRRSRQAKLGSHAARGGTRYRASQVGGEQSQDAGAAPERLLTPVRHGDAATDRSTTFNVVQEHQ